MVSGRFAYGSFRLRSVRLRLESIHLRLICQFAFEMTRVRQCDPAIETEWGPYIVGNTKLAICYFASKRKVFQKHVLGSSVTKFVHVAKNLQPAREKSWGLDLLQVDLTSFLASGAGFLGREEAKRATKLGILNRTEDFFESLPGDELAALQTQNRGPGGRGQWRGVGRGHKGYKHTSSPVLNQVLIIKRDRLLKSSRPFGAQI